MSGVEWVDIELVEEPLHLLRTADTDSTDFRGLLESMKADGFWDSKPLDVSVESVQSGPSVYILNDGMQRLTAARMLGLRQVPVSICEKALTEETRLERAIIAQATAVKTKPVEYGKGLAKLVELNEGITVTDLAKRVRKDAKWVNQMLRLAKLEGSAAALVDSGDVPIANGLALVDLQKAGVVLDEALVTKAREEDVAAFAEEAAAKLEEAKKGGRKKKEPVAKLRRIEDVKSELERARHDPSRPDYLEALVWVLRQDPVSAEVEGAAPVTAASTNVAAALAERDAIIDRANETIMSLRAQMEQAHAIPGAYVNEPGTLTKSSNDLAEVLHWALGSGADVAELVPNVSAETRALLERCEAEIPRAIEAITVKTLEKKLKTNAVSRWLKGERRASYSARRVILETVREPIYQKHLKTS